MDSQAFIQVKCCFKSQFGASIPQGRKSPRFFLVSLHAFMCSKAADFFTGEIIRSSISIFTSNYICSFKVIEGCKNHSNYVHTVIFLVSQIKANNASLINSQICMNLKKCY